MLKTKFQIVATLVLFFILANGSLAHHAISEDMDKDNPIHLQGNIIRVEWINPHVYIHFQIQNAYGVNQTWQVQADTPNGLLRRGLNRATLSTNTAPSIELVVFQTKDKGCVPNCMGYGY